MMKILLSPQVPSGSVKTLVLERRGDVLIVNGERLDLSFMAVGDTLQPGAIKHPLLEMAKIARTDDGITVEGVIFHIDEMQTDPAACFPDPVIITHDGVVALPAQVRPPPPPALEPELEPVATSTTEPEDEHQG